MSLPDHLLDPPDLCEEHGLPHPCQYCRLLQQIDRAEQWYEEWKERERDDGRH